MTEEERRAQEEKAVQQVFQFIFNSIIQFLINSGDVRGDNLGAEAEEGDR